MKNLIQTGSALFLVFTLLFSPQAFSLEPRRTANSPKALSNLKSDAGSKATRENWSPVQSSRFEARAVEPAKINLMMLPKTSLFRFYNVETGGPSFALDGFPQFEKHPTWQESLEAMKMALVVMVEQRGTGSMTTNQSLLKLLILSGALDGRILELKDQGLSAEQIYFKLYNEAGVAAQTVFGNINRALPGKGLVSIEASAAIDKTGPLVDAAYAISQGFSEGGVGYTKIPNLGPMAGVGASVGPEAIERATRLGVSANATLVFYLQQYFYVLRGNVLGLAQRVEDLRGKGMNDAEIREDLGRIHAANSIFANRVTILVDAKIDAQIATLDPVQDADQIAQLRRLKGKAGLAVIKTAYRIFKAVYLGQPFDNSQQLLSEQDVNEIVAVAAKYESIKGLGVRPQKILVASTELKSDQPYDPIIYVIALMSPVGVEFTLPQKTFLLASDWVALLDDAQIAEYKRRDFMSEPIPDVDQTAITPEQWRNFVINRSAPTIEPDQVLRLIEDLVLKPQGATMVQIGDKLRDDGAAAFLKDEQATVLQITERMQRNEARRVEAPVENPYRKLAKPVVAEDTRRQVLVSISNSFGPAVIAISNPKDLFLLSLLGSLFNAPVNAIVSPDPNVQAEALAYAKNFKLNVVVGSNAEEIKGKLQSAFLKLTGKQLSQDQIRGYASQNVDPDVWADLIRELGGLAFVKMISDRQFERFEGQFDLEDILNVLRQVSSRLIAGSA